MGKANILFISPHLDDAVLSCGGYIGKLCALGYSVNVVTIFSGSPEGKLSLLAQALHLDWRLPKDAPALRREEDHRALEVLGAEAVHAGFPDCIYRRDPKTGKPVYTRLGQILAQTAADEPRVVEAVAQYLADLVKERGFTHAFAPLGLGGHVDHLITHAAARLAMETCMQTQWHFFEDLPYAIEDAPDEKRTHGMRSYVCTRKDGAEQKYQAMAAYVSQVKSPRYSGGIDIDAIMLYGTERGICATGFAERAWTEARTRSSL